MIGPDEWVVDVGGGTGLRLATKKYVCLDLELPKLRRFRTATHGMAIGANAAQCPIRAGAIDTVLCLKVTHHLDDAALAAVFEEIERMTRPGGRLILVDALCSERWMARLLWAIDRGSHPREAEMIGRVLPSSYTVLSTQTFRVGVFHDFVVYVARRR